MPTQSTHRRPGQYTCGRSAEMFGAPPVIGAQTNAIWGWGIDCAPVWTPGSRSAASRASIAATSPPCMIR